MVVTSELNRFSYSFGTANSSNASGKYVLVASLGSFLKLEISGSEETRRKFKISSFVNDRYFLQMTSEALANLVSRFLVFLGRLPKRQNGPRKNIGSTAQYFMNNGWHAKPRVIFNK